MNQIEQNGTFSSEKKRYFEFILDLIDGRKDPNLENPLDTWDWDYLPEPFHGYDQNYCAEYFIKQKKS